MGDDITIDVNENVNNIDINLDSNDQVVDINVVENTDAVSIALTEIANDVEFISQFSEEIITLNVVDSCDDVTIGVTETVNIIEVSAQPNDQVIDIDVTDNTDNVTLNITPTLIEVNINKGGPSTAQWGGILGNLSDQTDLQDALDLKANDEDVVHLTGIETITGRKIFQNTGAQEAVIVNNASAGIGIYSNNTSDGMGINANNASSGRGIYVENSSTGTGIYSMNIDSGISAYFINNSDGRTLVLNNATSATGLPFSIQKNGVNKLTINDSGQVTGTKFNSGGTSVQFVKGDGSLDSVLYTPVSRTITINGTTLDLTDNRTWNVGTVTSVAALTLGTSGTDLSSTVATDTTTPVITLNVPTASATNRGALSSTDWTTFNNKQAALNGTGIVKSVSGTISYLTDNTANWNDAYDNKITSAAVTGTTTKTLTLNQQDGGTVTASWTDSDTAITLGTANGLSLVGQVLSLGLSSTSTNGALSSTDWNTFNGKLSGSGTTNYVPKFTGATTLGNSLIYDNGTNVGIGTTSPVQKLHVEGSSYFLTDIFTGNNGGIFFSGNSSYTSGIFQNASGLNLQTGGSPRLTITSSGNVGIGTTSPNLKLSVLGANGAPASSGTTQNGVFRLTAGTGLYNVLDFGINETNDYSWIQSTRANNLAVYDKLALQPLGGNVGIGTTSPNQKLSVIALNSTPTLAGNQGTFSVLQGAADYGIVMGTKSSGNGWVQVKRVDGTATAYDLELQPLGGNVGIGTTSPNYSSSGRTVVDINGTSQSMLALSVGGVGKSFLFYTGTDLLLSNESNGAIKLNTNGSEKAIITSGGNVGIGTSSPAGIWSGSHKALQITGGTNISSELVQSRPSATITRFLSGTSAEFGVYTADALNYTIYTSGSERMRITSGGKVGINTANPSYTFSVLSSNNVVWLQDTSLASGATFVLFSVTGSVNIGNISRIGTTNAVAYNTVSDYRLKEDLKEINGLEKLSKIKVYDFKWKDNEARMDGVIAHELQEVVPYAVTGEKDAEQMQSVDYSKLVPILVKAVQELKAEIEILKTK